MLCRFMLFVYTWYKIWRMHQSTTISAPLYCTVKHNWQQTSQSDYLINCWFSNHSHYLLSSSDHVSFIYSRGGTIANYNNNYRLSILMALTSKFLFQCVTWRALCVCEETSLLAVLAEKYLYFILFSTFTLFLSRNLVNIFTHIFFILWILEVHAML